MSSRLVFRRTVADTVKPQSQLQPQSQSQSQPQPQPEAEPVPDDDIEFEEFIPEDSTVTPFDKKMCKTCKVKLKMNKQAECKDCHNKTQRERNRGKSASFILLQEEEARKVDRQATPFNNSDDSVVRTINKTIKIVNKHSRDLNSQSQLIQEVQDSLSDIEDEWKNIISLFKQMRMRIDNLEDAINYSKFNEEEIEEPDSYESESE